jgi:hypothetical protein
MVQEYVTLSPSPLSGLTDSTPSVLEPPPFSFSDVEFRSLIATFDGAGAS